MNFTQVSNYLNSRRFILIFILIGIIYLTVPEPQNRILTRPRIEEFEGKNFLALFSSRPESRVNEWCYADQKVHDELTSNSLAQVLIMLLFSILIIRQELKEEITCPFLISARTLPI
jgi:hypothetical protein